MGQQSEVLAESMYSKPVVMDEVGYNRIRGPLSVKN